MKGDRKKMLRTRVAQEAALLLYTSQENEYKQAKQRGADTLGVRVLPSNFEVAEELDKIAEEREGEGRKEMLLRMRMEAKVIMETLKNYNPRLVGTVWRGTVRKNSDIDIQTFSQDHHLVVNQLQKHNYSTKRSKWCSITKKGKKESSFHIDLILQSGDCVEVVVRNLECLGKPERCETYGDVKKGLNLKQLSDLLKDNPLQSFVPFKNYQETSNS